MSKIKSFQLNNFKFFRQSDPIILDGKHLLLYGENGSGKSSVFWGLYTLLEAAYKQPNEVKSYFDSSDTSLVNIFANKQKDPVTGIEHYDSYITIETDNDKAFTASLLDTSICGNNDVKESRKTADFLNYQSLFAFQHFKNSESVDLSDVFDYYILPYVTFPPIRVNGKDLTNAEEMWKEYQHGPTKVRGYIRNNEKNEFQRFESHFKREFQKLIDFINQNSYDIIKELGYDIHFKLSYTSPSNYIGYKIYDYQKYKIVLTIDSYNGKSISINRPQTFLNEAKLTALALSIRLAVLKYRTNTLAPDALHVLILDDIMISLDMCNRESLLDLLLKKYSSKYQLLFLTHDKSLYEFVYYKIKQYKQNTSWIRKELYIGVDEKTKYEKPVIIDGTCEPIEKSKKHFAAKDYTASALFLRQSLEKLIGELLPIELRTKADGGFVSLQVLWGKLIDFYAQNGQSISSNIVKQFEDSKLLVLNSSAHFQRLSNPIYRKELLKAFDLYNELTKLIKIEKELVIGKGAKIEFDYPKANYKCTMELEKDLVIIEGDRLISVMPKCRNITWEYKGITFYDFDFGLQNLTHPLRTATPKLNKFIEGLIDLSLGITEEIFMENCLVDGTPLNDYFSGIKVSSLIVSSVKI